MSKQTVILDIQDLCISFTQYSTGLHQYDIETVKHLNLQVYEGEILAILGSSGSGKSLLAHAILGVLPNNASVSGQIYYKGELLTEEVLRPLRGRDIFLVPQTVNALDPLMKVGKQVRNAVAGDQKKEKQQAIFKQFNLEPHVEKMFPHQLSGGMARRVLISTAFVSGSTLLIADEPTPGMDAGAVDEMLSYMKNLSNTGATIVMIIHDIQTALKIADRVAIFHEGTVIDLADVADFIGRGDNLTHEYTKALWLALPQNDFIE